MINPTWVVLWRFLEEGKKEEGSKVHTWGRRAGIMGKLWANSHKCVWVPGLGERNCYHTIKASEKAQFNSLVCELFKLCFV